MKYRDDPKRPLTLRELEAIVEDLDLNEEIDVCYIPPDVDDITDEKNIDDNVIGGVENLHVDIAGTFEIVHPDNEIEIGDGIHHEAASSTPSKTARIEDITWCRTPIDYEEDATSNEEKNVKNIIEALHGKSVLDFFMQMFDENVIQFIISNSIKYARDNNRTQFTLNQNELEIFLGILILSGYHTLPQVKLYWSSDEDKGVEFVKNAMSRNRFLDIKQNIHLADNNQLDKTDKFAKVRPLVDLVNSNFLKYGIFKHHLSIDEQMVPYFGRHSAKMFLKGKPVRLGFKMWCLASSDGYLYQFIPYAGKHGENVKREFGLGETVVINLLKVLENKSTHKVYFDNFFTSYKLLVHLKSQGYFATGTVRENRMLKCPLETCKSIGKKPRGTMDSRYDHVNEISVLRWNDNSVVTVATNCESTEPNVFVKRYNRKEKKYISIPQPNMIANYNKYMGGVDLHDNAVANYRINIRGKKWWWPLFINMLDSAVVNAWKLHRLVYTEKPISQLDFRSELVRSLISANKCKTQSVRGRGSTASLPSTARLDNVGHIIERNRENWRRRCRVCKSTTVFMCNKCGIPLHTHCFKDYHN